MSWALKGTSKENSHRDGKDNQIWGKRNRSIRPEHVKTVETDNGGPLTTRLRCLNLVIKAMKQSERVNGRVKALFKED